MQQEEGRTVLKVYNLLPNWLGNSEACVAEGNGDT